MVQVLGSTITWQFVGVLAMVLGVLGMLAWIMLDKGNPLECWQFIATKGADGQHYADLDKVGKITGIVFGSWAVIKLAYDHPDLVGYAAVLGADFAFTGGSAGYSAFLRAKQALGDQQKEVDK